MADAAREAKTGPAPTSWEAEIRRLAIVEQGRVRIWRDPFRRLCVTVEDYANYLDVRPARVFPVSEAAGFVSFLGIEDKEALMLRSLCGLDPESRRVLEEEMTRAYFVPRIIQILEIEYAHGAARWEVETDRGYRLFDIRDREDVKVIEGRRVLLQDADGNRYEVADVGELDERSRRLIDSQI